MDVYIRDLFLFPVSLVINISPLFPYVATVIKRWLDRNLRRSFSLPRFTSRPMVSEKSRQISTVSSHENIRFHSVDSRWLFFHPISRFVCEIRAVKSRVSINSNHRPFPHFSRYTIAEHSPADRQWDTHIRQAREESF